MPKMPLKTPTVPVKNREIKTVTVVGKAPKPKVNVVGTSDAYKARVDSTNKANLAKDAAMRKARR